MTSPSSVTEDPRARSASTAKLEAGESNGSFVVKLAGKWKLTEPVPSWSGVIGKNPATRVSVVDENLEKWDSSLVLFLMHAQTWCQKTKCEWRIQDLPANLQTLLQQASSHRAASPQNEAFFKLNLSFAKSLPKQLGNHARQVASFIGECTLSSINAVKKPQHFRLMDCLVEMQHCWASSLPIVGLVSFLVGVILAFQAAIQLKQFGAAIYVADLVDLAVVREMGPMMAAVILAGGTGAGFAAQLGNMRVDEEIDALQTLGISSVDFLVLPRLVAVTVMMPILALYANVLGILGGMFVSATMLDIPVAAYWVETQNRVGFSDVSSGLIKSLFFGLAVGLAGCLRGIKCERNAAGVGKATSSAVVTGVTLIVLADALFAIIFNVLRI